MNKTIWKYELKETDKQIIELPKDAEILTVQAQFEKIQLWALVDPNKETETRVIELFGTGQNVGCVKHIKRKYISTFQLLNGTFILHAFELFT